MDDHGTTPAATAALLSPEELMALSLVQLRDIIRIVELHGIELGMLTSVLLDLIERHELAAQPRDAAGAPPADPLHEQLTADHRTMLAFNGPLFMLQQFYDRLRQRLEHLDAALQRLPHAAKLPAERLPQAAVLFPLSEERSATREASGAADDGAAEPMVELFT